MNSIRSQLTRHLVLSLAVLLGVGLAAIYATIRHALVGSFDETLRSEAFAVSALTEAEAGRVQFDFSADFLHSYSAVNPRNYFELWDGAGTSLARSPSLRGADLPLRTDGMPDRPVYWNFKLPDGHAARALAFTFVPDPADNAPARFPVSPVYLIVAADRRELNETLGGLFAAIAGGGGLLFLAVFLVVPRVLSQGLAPLNQLGEQAARIDAASLASRLACSELPAELRPIGERLNDLLARLESSFERERRFSADLAHELRTPIAELRSLAECALKWPDTRDSASDSDLLAIATQMETLVTRMLALARAERGQLAPNLVPVDLAFLTTRAWHPFADRAATRNLRPSFSLASAPVLADQVLLQSILSNLFANAVEYSPFGGVLRVTGQATANGYALQVSNLAAGLTPADMPRLFDRFWRKETARSGGEHFGLGLNLARTFAAAMGWRLTAQLDAQSWIVFTLTTGPTTGIALQ